MFRLSLFLVLFFGTVTCHQSHHQSGNSTDKKACARLDTPNRANAYYKTGVPLGKGKNVAIKFTVAAKNDAHVGFFTKHNDRKHMYEIVLSGWGNRQSVIRRANQGHNQVAVGTKKLLSHHERRQFWISVAATGWVKVGTGSKVGHNVFMQWKDKKPLAVTNVQVMSGWGSAAKWNICAAHHPNVALIAKYRKIKKKTKFWSKDWTRIANVHEVSSKKWKSKANAFKGSALKLGVKAHTASHNATRHRRKEKFQNKKAAHHKHMAGAHHKKARHHKRKSHTHASRSTHHFYKSKQHRHKRKYYKMLAEHHMHLAKKYARRAGEHLRLSLHHSRKQKHNAKLSRRHRQVSRHSKMTAGKHEKGAKKSSRKARKAGKRAEKLKAAAIAHAKRASKAREHARDAFKKSSYYNKKAKNAHKLAAQTTAYGNSLQKKIDKLTGKKK